MQTINSPEEYQEAVNGKKTSVIVWSANWCPDCVYIKPFLPDLEKEYPEIDFYMADRDTLLDLAIDEKILGIPSFVAYKDGKELSRFVSKLRKTKPEIEEYLSRTVKGEQPC